VLKYVSDFSNTQLGLYNLIETIKCFVSFVGFCKFQIITVPIIKFLIKQIIPLEICFSIKYNIISPFHKTYWNVIKKHFLIFLLLGQEDVHTSIIDTIFEIIFIFCKIN